MTETKMVFRGVRAAVDVGNPKAPAVLPSRVIPGAAWVPVRKAAMRAAERSASPEQRAIWIAEVIAEHPVLTPADVDSFDCPTLERWAKQCRDRGATRAAARAELAQKVAAAGPEVQAAVRAASAAPPDPYQRKIEEIRVARGITRPSLPEAYDPTSGYVADPYAERIAAIREARGIVMPVSDPDRDLSTPPDPYAAGIASRRAAMKKQDEERRQRRR